MYSGSLLDQSSLPVQRYKQKLLWAVNSHNVSIVIGEAGSGKSSVLPQYLYQAGWNRRNKKIAVALPRRSSAIALCQTVADELGSSVGDLVGYSVRFDKKIHENRTAIKFLTDGMLLREMLSNPLLFEYSVVIVDDAHERSLNTDILLGLLKRVLKKRPNLRVVISSATLDSETFLQFFKRYDYAYLRKHREIERPASRWDELPLECGDLQKKDSNLIPEAQQLTRSESSNAAANKDIECMKEREGFPQTRNKDTINPNDTYEISGKINTSEKSEALERRSAVWTSAPTSNDPKETPPALSVSGTSIDDDTSSGSESDGRYKKHKNKKKSHHRKKHSESSKRRKKKRSTDNLCRPKKHHHKKKSKRHGDVTHSSHRMKERPSSDSEGSDASIRTRNRDRLVKKTSSHQRRLFRNEITHYSEMNETVKLFLKDVCMIIIEDRKFTVDIHYLKEPTSDYLYTIVDTAMEVHLTEQAGDILIFLPGKDEVEAVVRAIKELSHEASGASDRMKIKPMPLYAELQITLQLEVLKPLPPSYRKVVCSTNIAETSVTIDNIGYVIDCGFTKVEVCDYKSGIEFFNVVPVSRASAAQRAHRSCQAQPGKCYRMMTEAAFYSPIVPEHTVPEILRTDLCGLLLNLKSFGIENILNIEFVSPPSLIAVEAALETLFLLDAIDSSAKLKEPLGVFMTELPLPPMLTRMIYKSADEPYDCLEAAVVTAAMLSVRSIWLTHKSRTALEASIHTLGVAEGDLLSYYNIFHEAMTHRNEGTEWFSRHCLNMSSILRVEAMIKQIQRECTRFQLKNATGTPSVETLSTLFCDAFFLNAAYKLPDGRYACCRLDETTHFEIHPNSVLSYVKPNWITFSQALSTGKASYMRNVSKINPLWLLKVAPHFYELSDFV